QGEGGEQELLLISSLIIGLVLLAIARIRRTLDVLALGRPTAIALGADYDRLNRRIIVAIAVLVAVPTALVGPVTFLGLLASNATYEMTKTFRHHVTIPLSALSAATLLVAAQFLLEELFDFATRPSIIVGFIGGIVFIVLVLREVK
ncbi:MAG: iron chelate uptake ABC transporter family permease subunit, partial [Actinomycetota bacterium]